MFLKVLEEPSTVILFPPETVAVFTCNISNETLPSWRINGFYYFRNDTYPTGHVLGNLTLTVTMGGNGSEYNCFVNSFGIQSDPAFLYYASKLFMHTYVCQHIITLPSCNMGINVKSDM